MDQVKSASPVMDERRIEFLLKVNSDRVNGLEASLEKNWIAHLILAAIGLALVFHIGNFRELLANYFVKGPYDQKAVAIVILGLLLYYFMKLGHLLTLYIESSRSQQQLLKAYLGEQVTASSVILRKSTNFYVEAFFSVDSFHMRDVFWPYLLITITIVSLAQASALFLIAQAYTLSRWLPFIISVNAALVVLCFVFWPALRKSSATKIPVVALMAVVAFTLSTACIRNGWPSVILLFAASALVTLYVLFLSSNREFPQTTIAVATSPIMASLWLLLFALASR